MARGHPSRDERATGAGWRGRAALLLAVVLVGTLLPAGSAAALTRRLVSRQPVAAGLVQEVYEVGTSRGTSRVRVLRFRLGTERLQLGVELGGGQVPGYEPTHRTLQRLGPAAVAGVNGTFQDRPPPGPSADPQGVLITGGRYASNAQIAGPKPEDRTWRSGFALFGDGSWDLGEPDYEGSLQLSPPDGASIPLAGVNRHPARPRSGAPDETEAVVLSDVFDDRTGTARGTVELVMPDVSLSMNTEVTGTVTKLNTGGSSRIPDDGVVVAATGSIGERLHQQVRPGEQVTVRLSSRLDWDAATDAAVAGPPLVRDGRPVGQDEWNAQGFGPQHNTVDHPRTAVGFTGAGRALLVTADGRQPGYSVGLTMPELRNLMLQLGAHDALSLDGGGATTMATHDRVVNHPSDPRPRGVSNSLVVRSVFDVPGGVRDACPDQVPDPGFEDLAGSVHRRTVACVAWYAVTRGLGDTDGDGSDEYGPTRPVSRAQMASFLARLVRGTGLVLPEDPPDAFEGDGGPHEGAINLLAALDLVAGTGDADGDGRGEFAPGRGVTRAQMASFVGRTYARLAGRLPRGAGDAFRDDDGSVHEDNVDGLAALGIVRGRGGGRYAPGRTVTRAQMGSFLARGLQQLHDRRAVIAGGADTRLQGRDAERGGALTGSLRTTRRLVALRASGCGLDDRGLVVGDSGTFQVPVPADAPTGICRLRLAATTTRAGHGVGDQTVRRTFDLSIG